MDINNLFKKLEDSGVNIDDFLNKHKLLEAIPDIIELCVKSIQEDYNKAGLYRENIKYKLNPVIRASENYNSYFWNKVAKNSNLAAEQLGELANNFMNKILKDESLFEKK